MEITAGVLPRGMKILEIRQCGREEALLALQEAEACMDEAGIPDGTAREQLRPVLVANLMQRGIQFIPDERAASPLMTIPGGAIR